MPGASRATALKPTPETNRAQRGLAAGCRHQCRAGRLGRIRKRQLPFSEIVPVAGGCARDELPALTSRLQEVGVADERHCLLDGGALTVSAAIDPGPVLFAEQVAILQQGLLGHTGMQRQLARLWERLLQSPD